jgi:uncharacterized protein (TIGR02246 family)
MSSKQVLFDKTFKDTCVQSELMLLDHIADESNIHNIFLVFQKSWNRHDMKLFSSIFSADADFVNVAGNHWKGRSEIEAKHAKAHDSQLNESTLEVERIEVRFIGPEIAVVHTDLSVRGDKDPNGIVRTGVRHTILSAIVLKQDDVWVIAAAQNTNKA